MLGGRKGVSRVLDQLGVFDLVMEARRRVNAPVLTVLCYHSIGDPESDYVYDPEVIDATAEEFRQQLAFAERHCTVVDVNDLCAIMDGEPPPPNPLMITFDDGYRSCYDVAFPILQEFGFPAVFFIATDYVQNRRAYWWDVVNYLVKSSDVDRLELTYPRAMTLSLSGDDARKEAIEQLLRLIKSEKDLELERFLQEIAGAAKVEWNRDIERAIADELIMTWDEIRAMRDAGMDIESHTRTHRVLQTISGAELDKELVGSSEDLERELGQRARILAYPVGHGVAESLEVRQAITAAGYRLGFTNGSGVNYLWRDIDQLDIRRVATERGLPLPVFRIGITAPPLAYRSKFHKSSLQGRFNGLLRPSGRPQG